MKKILLSTIFSLFLGNFISQSQTTLTCGATFTDNGGLTGNYLDNSDVTYIISPTTPGEMVSVIFNSFETEGLYDGLYVYNGNSITSPQIASINPGGNVPGSLPGAFWGSDIPEIITSSSPDGCLTFRFRSDGSINKAGWTASVVCGTVSFCAKPIDVSINGISFNSASLNWSEINAAAQWEIIVQPATDTPPSASSAGIIANSMPYSITNLQQGISYKAYVRSICSATTSSNWSTSLNFSPTSCSAPTTIIATNISSNSAVLNWSSLNATQWEVIVQPAADSPPTSTSNGVLTSTNTYNATGLVLGTPYKAYVRKICSNTISSDWGFSSSFSATNSCSAPTSITTNSVTENSATFNWNVGVNTNQWQVEVRPALWPAPTTSTTGTIVNQNTYTATDLVLGTSYKFYVRSVCNSGYLTTWSTGFPFSTSVTLPPLTTSTSTYTPEQLVTNVLINNPCISVTNVTSSTGTNFGSTNGIGYFTNTNPTFPLSSGIVLSTGNVNNVPGPNNSVLSDGSPNWTGDSQLESIILAGTGNTMQSFNATKLEFDFTSLNEFMSFNFLFASDEYGTYQCAYADAFAFLLTDLTTGVTTNLAVVPGTTTPVSVVTIRDLINNTSCPSVNSGFFGTYFAGANAYASATNFNGQTVEMSASSAIISNHPYHIKLVIADRGDSIYDSAVFIKAGSFTSGPPACADKIELVAFIDANANGVKDTNEVNFTYGNFVYQLNNTGNLNNISSPFGNYTLYDSNPINTYDFSYSLNSESATNFSVGTTNYNDINIPLGSGTTTLYFPIVLTNPYNDVSVSILPVTPPRPGFNYTNKIIYRNLGIATTSGTVTFTKSPLTTITYVSQTGVVNNSTGLSYDFTNLAPFETRNFNVIMSVPGIPTVNIDDVLTNSATVSAPSGDINLTNNSYSNSQVVVASYDPNDKSETHGGKIQFNQFTTNDYLYYTIRFQNEGTANAINIKIEDLLDSRLDESSIRVVSASHNYFMKRVNNQITFNFDYINLPPALANQDLSKGYVFFKIKLKPGFTVGDVIPNAANIYFDSNPAIVTNTFNTEFVTALDTLDFEAGNLIIFPNPTNDFVQISLKNNNDNIKDVTIYDVVGKTVKEVKSINSYQTNLNVSELSSGIYMIEVISENNLKQIKKLIIK